MLRNRHTGNQVSRRNPSLSFVGHTLWILGFSGSKSFITMLSCYMYHVLYGVALSDFLSWFMIFYTTNDNTLTYIDLWAILVFCVLTNITNGALSVGPVAVIITGRFFSSSLWLWSSSQSLSLNYMREARMWGGRPHSLTLPTKSLCGLLMKNLRLHIDYGKLIMTMITVLTAVITKVKTNVINPRRDGWERHISTKEWHYDKGKIKISRKEHKGTAWLMRLECWRENKGKERTR